MTNIYVGNLSYQTSSTDLETAFSEYGEVSRASVVADRESGRSRGFGFVEMPDATSAQAAIDGLNDQNLDGRNLKVNIAKPREERSRTW